MNLREKVFANIKDNKISMTFCTNCKLYIWPPSYFCKNCFNITKIKRLNNKGKLIEITFSNILNEKIYYGIGDFSGIKIIGSTSIPITVNKEIMISKVNIRDNKLDIVFSEVIKYP